MAQLSLPPQLLTLLSGSEFEPAVGALSVAARTVLADNTMPFFPAFTGHGVDHVEAVLRTAARLVPDDVWAADLMRPADGVALVCACILHDLGMHVRELGFAELVSNTTPFLPMPFFDEVHSQRPADAPWPELWATFRQEARHFGPGQLAVILGPSHRGVPRVAFTEAIDPAGLDEPDKLLIGEFLRRHHARLAHEIAVTGFPGAGDSFPVLAETLPGVGELAGVIARSHNEDLRLMMDYLDELEQGNRRPGGVLAAYQMSLLRVADYLQIEADRAPSVLLRLKAPQSRVSIEEWNKHRAVDSVSWEHSDPNAIAVSVDASHGLRTHLALRELLEAMQTELDQTWAVLDEHYDQPPLDRLRLARRRVVSNLDQPRLHQRLSYIPRRAALRSDPDLFRLMVRDLYSNECYVAGRELVQNAVDAIRALRRWERTHGPVPEDRLTTLEADVLVTLEADKDDAEHRLILRVTDRGIGMSPETVIDYYLAAGASFGPLRHELESMNAQDAVASMKAGRFGVGAFAAFLLGPEIRVTTRQPGTARGVSFSARLDSDLVQLEWVDAPVGTSVEIPFAASVIEGYASPPSLLATIASSYRLGDPAVVFRHDGNEVIAPADVPHPGLSSLPAAWFPIETGVLEAAYWRVRAPEEQALVDFDYDDEYFTTSISAGDFVHNGIVVERPYAEPNVGGYTWSDYRLPLTEPLVAAFDPRHQIGLALHRFELLDTTLPFEAELLDSVGVDLLVHALVRGPEPHPLIDSRQAMTPSLLTPIYHADGFLPAIVALLPEGESKLYLMGATDALEARLHRRSGSLAARLLTDGSAIPLGPNAFRAIGGPPSASPFLRSSYERESTLDDALRGLRRSADDLMRTLCSRQVRSVVVAKGLDEELWDGTTDRRFQAGFMRRSITGRWRHLGAVPRRRSTHAFAVEPADGPGVEQSEVQAAIALSRRLKEDWACLTIVSDFEPGPAFCALGSAWRRYLNGAVPHDPEARRAVAEQIEREHPETRRHFAYWRGAK